MTELPLVLLSAPPGLSLVLAQEGVPFVEAIDEASASSRAGRFVIHDGRANRPKVLGPGQVAIDLSPIRSGFRSDPFNDLIDHRAADVIWRVGDLTLRERMGLSPKRLIRERVVSRLRDEILSRGGVWLRLGAFPRPYRSAFNLRLDLDENLPDDYARFARARRPLDDCSTHFVSTAAYGLEPRVLDDLRGLDAQSHGHRHHVYREVEANRRNLDRARELLRGADIEPTGFAGPHGRWNPGLDQVLEESGYLYSSDFQVGFDDLPFRPYRDGGFSPVLQAPVHPICEGLFLDAGERVGATIAEYYASVVRAKIEAEEPAFVYGHPERRLARYPEILEGLAGVVEGTPGLWRVTLTEFARWWKWREARRWSVRRGDGDRLEVRFDGWDARYPAAIQIVGGRGVADVSAESERFEIDPRRLEYRPPPSPAKLPARRVGRAAGTWKGMLREAIDWEVVTPIEELRGLNPREIVKRGLRVWKDARRVAG